MFNCKRCKKLQSADKKLDIWKLPPCLVRKFHYLSNMLQFKISKGKDYVRQSDRFMQGNQRNGDTFPIHENIPSQGFMNKCPTRVGSSDEKLIPVERCYE
jgi:ubiquitin C-terminal hydrolase